MPRIILSSWMLLLVAMALYPPWMGEFPGVKTALGYSWIFAPPSQAGEAEVKNPWLSGYAGAPQKDLEPPREPIPGCHLDIERLAVQELAVAAVAGAFILSGRTRKA
jgi:hypothetical protein